MSPRTLPPLRLPGQERAAPGVPSAANATAVTPLGELRKMGIDQVRAEVEQPSGREHIDDAPVVQRTLKRTVPALSPCFSIVPLRLATQLDVFETSHSSRLTPSVSST